MLFLVHFNSFSWRILTFTDEESPKVGKLVQIFNFEGVLNELFAKNCSHRQSRTKYIGNLKELVKYYKISEKASVRFLSFSKIG